MPAKIEILGLLGEGAGLLLLRGRGREEDKVFRLGDGSVNGKTELRGSGSGCSGAWGLLLEKIHYRIWFVFFFSWERNGPGRGG